ncbi:Anaerobic dimethyl sulfoxide reductase chain B [Planctomycetes bacterium MalM25]|nr:Anaerobic dimethyl sulfoxide reductase chain B [Planctomycetes bacterium MalM25]
MSATLASEQPNATGEEPAELLRALLEESRELTAVERFAKQHDESGVPAQAKYYRDLIPAGPPGAGEQYAFDVDLDACSGCKACVSACHHLNGLDTEETWRSVGQLYGPGSFGKNDTLPVIQHVTTACHHCVDPGCLAGCPTNAYEKDPITGVVRHLDDQCFGCQYCTMACPYEVPQYSESKGIVRKCDMCHDRLAAGEAPACVQACPNQAIRISVVNVAESVSRTGKGLFLPETPPAQLTNPTTVYRTQRGLPPNSVAADADHAAPQHAHAPLVAMLVLTQMSVGAVAVGALMRWFGAESSAAATIVLGALAGQAGLAVAPLHLGRPHLAFRAVLGWRHSWLSREAILFGVYAAFSIGAASFAALPYVSDWLPGPILSLVETFLPTALQTPAEVLAILSGAVAVFCSAKIYMFTGRRFWLGHRTLAKFGLTPLVLGLATGAACSAVLGGESTALLAGGLFATLAAKLVYEASLLISHPGDLEKTARIQQTALRNASITRFGMGILGIALAGPLMSGLSGGAVSAILSVLMLGAVLVGELAERWLYFGSVVPLKMPGGTPT